MKLSLFSCLLAGIFLLSLPSLAQIPDTKLFETRLHIEGNDTLPFRLYRSEKAKKNTDALPLVVFLHGAGSRLDHLSRIGPWMLGPGLLHPRNFQMVVRLLMK